MKVFEYFGEKVPEYADVGSQVWDSESGKRIVSVFSVDHEKSKSIKLINFLTWIYRLQEKKNLRKTSTTFPAEEKSKTWTGE